MRHKTYYLDKDEEMGCKLLLSTKDVVYVSEMYEDVIKSLQLATHVVQLNKKEGEKNE